MQPDDPLLGEARAVDQQLQAIRRALLRAYEADERRGGLTPAQLQAMTILTEALREAHTGMTISALSRSMGLAQSTVSSLVERLERKKMVTRQADPADRRRTLIHLTEAVKTYMQHAGPEGRLRPLIGVLRRATARDRQKIHEGLAILQELLSRPT